MLVKTRGRKKIIYRHALQSEVLKGPVFRVNNSMIKGYDFCFEIIKDLITRRLLNEDLDESMFMKWGRDKLKAGIWFYGARDREGILERRRKIFELYDYIRINGYDPVAALDYDQRYSLVTWPISVKFDETGQIFVCDGFHRLSILKMLGIKTDVDCIITNSPQALDTKRTGITKGDFPLDEVLEDINSGKNLYQPNKDPRCKGWLLWRQDSSDRLALLLDWIQGRTVLDIGCNAGYFTRELMKKNFEVTGIDLDARNLAVARYLATKENLNPELQLVNWLEIKMKHWDTIIMMSVWHHAALADLMTALEGLKRFKGHCDRMIIETVIDAARISWTDNDQKDAFQFTREGFIDILEETTGMKVVHSQPDLISRGYFFVLEARQ